MRRFVRASKNETSIVVLEPQKVREDEMYDEEQTTEERSSRTEMLEVWAIESSQPIYWTGGWQELAGGGLAAPCVSNGYEEEEDEDDLDYFDDDDLDDDDLDDLDEEEDETPEEDDDF